MKSYLVNPIVVDTFYYQPNDTIILVGKTGDHKIQLCHDNPPNQWWHFSAQTQVVDWPTNTNIYTAVLLACLKIQKKQSHSNRLTAFE